MTIRLTFPKIKKAPMKVYQLRSRPEIISQVSNLVEIVLNNKREAIETLALENQIDQLVCQIYGLTEEEVEIIENSL